VRGPSLSESSPRRRLLRFVVSSGAAAVSRSSRKQVVVFPSSNQFRHRHTEPQSAAFFIDSVRRLETDAARFLAQPR
jgi:hypothetical protein